MILEIKVIRDNYVKIDKARSVELLRLKWSCWFKNILFDSRKRFFLLIKSKAIKKN